MTGFAARCRGFRCHLALVVSVFAGLAQGQEAAAPENSRLDAPLFYQLLIGEIELREGRAGNAFEVILDAARRQGDEALFQRAVDIALQGRAGDQALAATLAWRTALPRTVAPLRYQTQILVALNRVDDAAEPLSAWLHALPVMERPGLISGLPRLLQGVPDRKQALALMQKVLAPYREAVDTRTASRVALGRGTLAAGQPEAALVLARMAQRDDPGAPGPALLALDMLPATPSAEPVVLDYLARTDALAAVRLAYVRLLTQSQRYADASQQLEQLTRERPQLPEPWLSLGALRLELKQTREAEAALQRYVALVGAAPAVAAADGEAGEGSDEDDTAAAPSGRRDLTQAWLLLAQAAEQRGDLIAAEAWLNRVDNPQRALEVQSRRASLLVREGKIEQARALIRAVPERNADDARSKALAEAQLLREAKQWRAAHQVLAAASLRFPDDTDLIYEQAMVAEKLDDFPEMERQLRRVIALKPEHPHAHNALGYSLADRNVRLPEARDLIQQALVLAPGDPFITDSLGWVEFRLGNRDEAVRLLRQAYTARPDTEIAAHLGEVLWASGKQDEARNIWQLARSRDAGNEVLKETLARLKVGL
jgi:tetratricopeptide (TPR) repeat protein